MHKRHWLSLVALAWLGAGAAPAQPEKLDRPSHRPVPQDPSDLTFPNEDLAERLRQARPEGLKDLPPEVADLARRLLKDPEFVKSLKERMGPGEVERLLERFKRGENLKADPALKRLLREEGVADLLGPKDKDVLERWQKGLDPKKGGPGAKQGEGPGDPKKPGPDDKASGPSGASEGPAAPPPSRWDRLEERGSKWVAKNLDGWIDGLDRWVDSPGGRSWRDTLARAARRASASGRDSGVADRARGLSRYVPRLGQRLQGLVPTSWRAPRAPAVPRVGGSLSSASSPGLASSGKGLGLILLWVVAVGVLALLLWKVGARYRLGREERRGWRLGPWPVDPRAVTTRADLVRAFEYLALLCLGPAARTRHHLELAERLGNDPAPAQPGAASGGETGRRRAAAEELARLYEQARYAPEDEPLSAGELRAARRDLCYLAGVSAA
jgi:hypothetical protein